MHRKILFGIIAAVVCGLFVSAQTAQAGAYMTSASRYQYGGIDYWTFYYSTTPTGYAYWVNGDLQPYDAYQGSDYYQIQVSTGTYGWDNNAIYVSGGGGSDSYVIFHPDGSYEIYNQ